LDKKRKEEGKPMMDKELKDWTDLIRYMEM